MVHVSLVTWNSLPYIKFCLQSLEQQSYKNISVVIIDNNSNDGTLEFLAHTYPHFHVIQNTSNRGFAAAHNQGIRWHMARSKWPITNSYTLVLNPDVILTPNYIATVINIMEREPKAAGITGQLLRYRLENKKVITTNAIDSEGLEMLPWRAVRERHSGQKIRNSKFEIRNSPPTAVWGISGACGLYRLSALEEIKTPIIENRNEGIPSQRAWSPKWFSEQTGGSRRVPTVGPCSERPKPRGEAPGEARKECPSDTPSEYFDEDFFCYKEDVDLSWRMRTRGWEFLYTPYAQAFHKRGIGHDTPHTQRHAQINQWSYRNHFYTLLKNETLKSFLLRAPLILVYEMAKFVYYLLVQPRTLLGLRDVYNNTTKMLKKRKHILCNYPSSS